MWQSSATGTYTVGGSDGSCDLRATGLSLSGAATLRDCPWNDTDLTSGPLDPGTPTATNIDDVSADKDIVVDNTRPVVVFDGFFDDWACTTAHTSPSATEYWVDGQCSTYVYFRTTVTDDGSIPAQFIEGGVSNGGNVDVNLSCGTADHLGFVESVDVTLEANHGTHPTQIIARGRARICCLPSCPAANVLSEWLAG